MTYCSTSFYLSSFRTLGLMPSGPDNFWIYAIWTCQGLNLITWILVTIIIGYWISLYRMWNSHWTFLMQPKTSSNIVLVGTGKPWITSRRNRNSTAWGGISGNLSISGSVQWDSSLNIKTRHSSPDLSFWYTFPYPLEIKNVQITMKYAHTSYLYVRISICKYETVQV